MTVLAELEKQRQAHLLALGALALEMHQGRGIEPDALMEAAARVAETEREIEDTEAAQQPREGRRFKPGATRSENPAG